MNEVARTLQATSAKHEDMRHEPLQCLTRPCRYRSVMPNFFTKKSSPCDVHKDKERDNVSIDEVLVVNQMTWPELARQCIVANVSEFAEGGTVSGVGCLGRHFPHE